MLHPASGSFVGQPSYSYGVVPGPGVPSGYFVDLFNTQRVNGVKTWLETQTVEKAAQAGAEVIASWSVSDDNQASLQVVNGTGTSSVFLATIRANGTNLTSVSNSYLTIDTRIGNASADASAGSGMLRFLFFRDIAGTLPVVNRYLIDVRNSTTPLLSITANGDAFFRQAGRGIVHAAGAGAIVGRATLVAGTVTILIPTVDANTEVFLTRRTAGGTIGNLTYTVAAGASITINSDNVLDTSVVSYKCEKTA